MSRTKVSPLYKTKKFIDNSIMQNVFQLNFDEIDSYLKNEYRYNSDEICLSVEEPIPNYGSINDFIKQSEDILQDTIRKIVLSKQRDEVEVYKKADIDRKLFSKIRTQPDYHPNKNTLLKLCLAMNLSTDETENLLKSAGYSLSRSLRTDLILRYCFGHQIFDVITVNQILDYYGEKVI